MMETYINSAVKPRFNLEIPLEPVIYSRMFLEILAEEGVEPVKLLTGTGLSVADLADPANLITVIQQIRIYANIADFGRSG